LLAVVLPVQGCWEVEVKVVVVTGEGFAAVVVLVVAV